MKVIVSIKSKDYAFFKIHFKIFTINLVKKGTQSDVLGTYLFNL